MMRKAEGQEQPWRLRPELSGGGLFVDLASHTLDILDYLLGHIGEVKGFARNQPGQHQVEDIVTTTYAFESGIMGTGVWSFNAFKRSDVTKITGSLGKIAFSTFGDELFIEMADGSKEERTIPYPAHVQQPLIQKVIDKQRGVGKSPSNGVTAARTNRVMDEMLCDFYRQP